MRKFRPAHLSALAAARALRTGALTSVALVEDCLANIEAFESAVGAWAYLDAERAREQARVADQCAALGARRGWLDGIPVGIKDIFDTFDMPTELGTPLHHGRQAPVDAAAVAALRRQGAVIMGKTVTTEFAIAIGGKTTNPHDPARTPGGSSSGSAAAVAARMVPLAIGSQTGGSIIRPAAFCGCAGYKPSFGWLPRTGMQAAAPSLDHVGVLARTVADCAFIAQYLIGADPGDPATTPPRRIRLHPIRPTIEAPRLAFVRTPMWDQVTKGTRDLMLAFVQSLPAQINEIVLPSSFDQVLHTYQTIAGPEMAATLAADHATGAAAMSVSLRSVLDAGKAVPAVDYIGSIATLTRLRTELGRVLGPYDAAITPATLGPAPLLSNGTGSPLCCLIWSLCGAPAISLPLLAIDGLPIGVQLVAPHGADDRLLAAAQWLERVGFPR